MDAKTKDQSGDFQKAIDYLTVFQETLPGMIKNILPDLDVKEGAIPSDLLGNQKFTATIAAKEMTLDECCRLLAVVSTINGFQATMQGVSHYFMKGKSLGDAISEADDYVRLIAAYIIELILSVNPSLISRALTDNPSEASTYGDEFDTGKNEHK